MTGGKKKSSGWRREDKRGTPMARHVRQLAADAAAIRGDCNRLGLWRTCPVRGCRRAARCSGDVVRCEARGRTARAANAAAQTPAREPKRAAAASPQRAAAPVMSAAEAAAAIAASIAAMPPER
jgi:hypothetical protein